MGDSAKYLHDNPETEGIRIGDKPVKEWKEYTRPEESKEKTENAKRFNQGKLRWGLVHYKSLNPLVKVLMFGAGKYGDNNWMKGLNRREILESLVRHATAMLDGETHDEESGLEHIGHIQCNAMFYQYMVDHGLDAPPLNKPS